MCVGVRASMVSSMVAACQALAAPSKPPKSDCSAGSQALRSASNSHASPRGPSLPLPPYRHPCAAPGGASEVASGFSEDN